MIRLMISLATMVKFRNGYIFVKKACIQSVPIRRELSVGLPREVSLPIENGRGPLNIPYGIGEAGRQCEKVIEHWIINKTRFSGVQ